MIINGFWIADSCFNLRLTISKKVLTIFLISNYYHLKNKFRYIVLSSRRRKMTKNLTLPTARSQ